MKRFLACLIVLSMLICSFSIVACNDEVIDIYEAPATDEGEETEKETQKQTEKETEYVQYLGKHIDAEFLYQTISPIVTSIPYGDQIIGILDFLRKKSDEQ